MNPVPAQLQPPVGLAGARVTVKTNSFAITTPQKVYYHYDVVIMKLNYRRRDATGQPERKEVKLQRRYMDVISKMHDEYPAEFTPRPNYDGVKNMFSTVKHNNATYSVHMINDPKKEKGVHEVRIALVNEIRPHLLQRLIAAGSHSIDTTVQKRDRMNPDAVSPPMNLDATALMLLQVIVTQAPHIRHKFSMHSKAFYIESRARNLSGGLQALPGFFQSVRPSIGRFLINVDTTTAAFYKKGWLLNLALEYLGVREARDVVRATKENRAKWSSLRTFLRGLNVMIVPQATNFNSEPPRNDSYRVFRITDIVADAGNITFDGPDGPTTIKNYWQNTHNTGIRYPDLFGISIGRDTIFPAEKCWVLPGQRYTRKLSPDAMNTFLTVSKSKPMDRIRDIEKAVNGPDLDYAASSWMREAGITVNPQALHIDGRQLNPPSIEYASNTQVAVSDGKWNVVKKKFLMPREINAMGVIVFDAQAQEADVVNFVQKLYTNMQALGIVMKLEPTHICYRIGNQQKPTDSMTEAAKATVNRLPVVNGVAPRPDMMIVILPAQAAPIRQAVKYWGDVSNGISTQCVRRGKYDVQRGNSLDQYCNNVALKINAKLGGMNCTFRDSNVDTALRYAMVVGCDISHPAPGVKNRPSIASLVASIDERCVRYSAHVRCQDPRQEVIADLRGMLLDAIDSFKKRFNNHVPVKIIIYRDGVSEGEYARVISNEINQVEEALNAIEPRPPYKPQIVFVVVGKRHHVRFFPTGQSPADSSGNCRAGLVVDREIVHSRFLSFYLQSHGGIIGTSRPSNYVVLRNDPNWTPDHLQGVSFALCHVYAPATRSVSIPAPVYYADKLCTHAAYQFKSQDGLADYDDSSSGIGTHDDAPFNLQAWQERLKPAHGAVRDKMYFI